MALAHVSSLRTVPVRRWRDAERMTIAKLTTVVLDCPDPLASARFYAEVTGWEIRPGDSLETDEWIQLAAPAGAEIAFQRATGNRPPQWPSDEHPQQLHLDFKVADLDEGERQVLALGARKAEVQPGTSFRVFLDPAGHPFCLCQA